MPEINYNCHLQPVGDRLIVQQDAAEETTKGGLIIPDTAKEKPQKATIIRVGTGRGVDNEVLQLLNQIKKGIRWGLIKLGAASYADEHLPVTTKTETIYQAGMRVLIGRYAGSEIEYKDIKYLIIRMSDIAAIIEDE